MPPKELLKVIYLQGYRQNKQVSKEKTGSLRKALKNYCEFVIISAPNVIPNVDSETPLTGWWFSNADKSYLAQEVSDCCDGFNKSLDVVAKALQEHGPVDGIVSFSQGASLLSIICGLKQEGDSRFQDFKFAVFFAAFKSRQNQHQKYYKQKIDIPSLHVIGDGDQVISREMSDELLEVFSSKVVVRHPGGHFIPMTSQLKKSYAEFFSNLLETKKSSANA